MPFAKPSTQRSASFTAQKPMTVPEVSSQESLGTTRKIAESPGADIPVRGRVEERTCPKQTEPFHEQRCGTFRLTARLLCRFLPGEMRGLGVGLIFLLSASALTLLQPWPIKVVLDSVVGK